MKGSHVLGIIIALALITFGIAYPTPEKHLRVSGYQYDTPWSDEYGEEYVGGDAYNYQMEASLKAGYMGGLLALKGITLTGGLILFFMSLYAGNKNSYLEAQVSCLQEISKKLTDLEKEQKDIKSEIEKKQTASASQSNIAQQIIHPSSQKPASQNKSVSARHAASSRSKPSKSKEDLAQEILNRIEQMNTAEEIYNFVVNEADRDDKEMVKFLELLYKSVITERSVGNNKSGAASLVKSFLKHDMRVFSVERANDSLTCPVCGKEQHSDRHSCQSCGALFQL